MFHVINLHTLHCALVIVERSIGGMLHVSCIVSCKLIYLLSVKRLQMYFYACNGK